MIQFISFKSQFLFKGKNRDGKHLPPEISRASLEIIASYKLLFPSRKYRQTGLMNEYQGRRNIERRLSHRRLPGNSGLCKSITRLTHVRIQ